MKESKDEDGSSCFSCLLHILHLTPAPYALHLHVLSWSFWKGNRRLKRGLVTSLVCLCRTARRNCVSPSCSIGRSELRFCTSLFPSDLLSCVTWYTYCRGPLRRLKFGFPLSFRDGYPVGGRPLLPLLNLAKNQQPGYNHCRCPYKTRNKKQETKTNTKIQCRV